VAAVPGINHASRSSQTRWGTSDPDDVARRNDDRIGRVILA